MSGAPRFTGQVLKRLKRRYGVAISVVRRTASTTNLRFGTKTVTRESFDVKRALVLPQRLLRNQDPAGFQYGGIFDVQERPEFIIDQDDTTFKPEAGHYVVFDGRRYDIEEVIEYGTAYVLRAKQEVAHDRNAVFNQSTEVGATLTPSTTEAP